MEMLRVIMCIYIHFLKFIYLDMPKSPLNSKGAVFFVSRVPTTSAFFVFRTCFAFELCVGRKSQGLGAGVKIMRSTNYIMQNIVCRRM